MRTCNVKIWVLKNKQSLLIVKNVYISSALGNVLNIGHIAGELLSLLYTWEGKKREIMGTIIILIIPQAEFQLPNLSSKVKVSFQSFLRGCCPFQTTFQVHHSCWFMHAKFCVTYSSCSKPKKTVQFHSAPWQPHSLQTGWKVLRLITWILAMDWTGDR